MTPQATSEFDRQYAALTAGAGVVDFGARTQLELTGNDRAPFLHNLCTNAVRELPPGGGCEAFVLNVKGHVVGHVMIFAAHRSHVVETVPGQAGLLLGHFDRYLIREDVQLHDRSSEWSELLLAGAQAESLLSCLNGAIPSGDFSHTQGKLQGHRVWPRRVQWTGPNDVLLAMPREQFEAVKQTLIAAGAMACGEEAAETARIEYGTPYYGRDISDENLPQEVDRNRQAISFTKGCYLGQETVARIDALGHVNRLLRGVRFLGDEIPSPGTELRATGKPVGRVTSSCWSPRWGAPLALAYVRRGHDEPGAKLESTVGAAEVVALPLPQRQGG